MNYQLKWVQPSGVQTGALVKLEMSSSSAFFGSNSLNSDPIFDTVYLKSSTSHWVLAFNSFKIRTKLLVWTRITVYVYMSEYGLSHLHLHNSQNPDEFETFQTWSRIFVVVNILRWILNSGKQPGSNSSPDPSENRSAFSVYEPTTKEMFVPLM